MNEAKTMKQCSVGDNILVQTECYIMYRKFVLKILTSDNK
jgi:hypothetical protein